MRFKRAIKAKQQRKKVILKGKAANDHQPVNEQKASQRRFRRLSRNKQNKEKRVNQQEQLIKSSSKRKQPNNERQKKSETKKTNVQKIRQKQDRRKQILLKKQKNARISTIKNNKKNQAAKYEYKKQETKTQKSNAKILEKTQTKNKNVPKKIKRKNGKKTTFKKKNLKDKIGKNIKNNISPKHKFKEMLIDKFGRDANGELNIIGFLLSIILLVPFLSTLIIVIAVLAVVIAIIAVILAIWAFIIALFTIKTEDMAITEAYDYVTWLDAYKNKEVYNRYKQLVEDDKYKKVYFEVNGVEADPEKFSFSSNSDNYVYYLNAKYEDYDINKSVLPTYYDRLKKSTGSVPSAAGLHVEFKDTPHPMNDEPVKIYTVKNEIHAMHDMTFTYKAVLSDDVATLKVDIRSLGEMLDLDPQVNIYSGSQLIGTIPAFAEDEKDKFYPILEVDRFESKIFMDNPLGKTAYSSVIENYGYRGRDDENRNMSIMLKAEPGSPVYATTSETVKGINLSYEPRDRDGKIKNAKGIKTDMGSYYVNYINVTPVVRSGTKLKEGDLIGYTSDSFDGNLMISMKEQRIFIYADPEIVPTIFIDHLSYANRPNLGYNDLSQLRGSLINPPEKVTKWREKVTKEAKKNNIELYVNALLSIIWVESGGDEKMSSDIMGIVKAKGLTRSVDVNESIELGVKYFAELLKKAQQHQLGDLAAAQAYNYGDEYLEDLIRLNGKYSLDNSILYAKERSDGKSVPYNSTVSLNLGYTWRYVFGNMFYAKLISYNLSQGVGEMLEIAKKEIGTTNGDKYWQWGGFDKRVEWSALFVSWVADQVGYIDEGRVPKTASPFQMMKWFKENNKFKEPDKEYLPQPGDLIFFDWKGNKTGKDHVGIVEYTGGNIVQIIEGNSDNLVRRKTYTLDNFTISGYGTP